MSTKLTIKSNVNAHVEFNAIITDMGALLIRDCIGSTVAVIAPRELRAFAQLLQYAICQLAPQEDSLTFTIQQTDTLIIMNVPA